METYKGYPIVFCNISWSCRPLKLFGYSTETALKRAIDRELKKREGKK